MKFYLSVVVLFFELINSSAGNFYFPDQVEKLYVKTTTEAITTVETTNISRISYQKCEEFKSLSYKTVGVVNLMFGARPTFFQTPNCDVSLPLKHGGELVKRGGDFPHLTQIGRINNGKHFEAFCSGSLISEKFVLTVASCKNHHWIPEIVRLGVIDSHAPNEGTYYNVLEFRSHPNYDEKSRHNDIALIKLNQDVFFNKIIKPACIGQATGQNSAIATSFGYSGNLVRRRVNFYDESTCFSVFNRNLTSNEICAGEDSNGWKVGICKGGNGGAIQIVEKENLCLYKLIGILTCAGEKPIGPNIYTFVYPYLDWIEEEVWAP